MMLAALKDCTVDTYSQHAGSAVAAAILGETLFCSLLASGYAKHVRSRGVNLGEHDSGVYWTDFVLCLCYAGHLVKHIRARSQFMVQAAKSKEASGSARSTVVIAA